MFYEAMEEILPDLKVIIESPSGDMQTIYPIESFVGTDTSVSNAGSADTGSATGTN